MNIGDKFMLNGVLCEVMGQARPFNGMAHYEFSFFAEGETQIGYVPEILVRTLVVVPTEEPPLPAPDVSP